MVFETTSFTDKEIHIPVVEVPAVEADGQGFTATLQVEDLQRLQLLWPLLRESERKVTG